MTESPLFEILLLLIIAAAVGGVLWYSMTQKRKQTEADAYLEALEYLAEGNDRMAIQKFKEAVRDDTENVSAYLRLGDLLRKKGLLSNAIRIHKDLTLRGTLPSDQKIRILQSLLSDYDQAKDYENGISIANKILELDREPEVWVVQKLIDLLEKTKDWKAAEETVNKYSKILPTNYSQKLALYLVFLGIKEEENGNGKEARIKFKEALKKDQKCAAAYYYLGKSYQREDRLEEAVKHWNRLVNEAPEKAHIVYPELEKAWFEMGRFADAENLYQEQLSKPKKGLKAGLALAEIYTKKGEYDNAIEVLNQLEEEFQFSPELINKKVNVYYNKGQYKQAASQSLSFFNDDNWNVNTAYRCKVCNHKSKTPLWMCPKCNSLDSYDI